MSRLGRIMLLERSRVCGHEIVQVFPRLLVRQVLVQALARERAVFGDLVPDEVDLLG